MRVGDVYVGLGLGDVDPEVGRVKDFMRRKFASYAGDLADTDVFDQQLVDAVMEMQLRYGLPVTGIVNYATKVRMGFIVPPPPPKQGVLLTLQGTGVDMWTGPPADVARAVEDKYYFQPVAYPAAPFPMWPSIEAGRAEAIRLLTEEHPTGDIRIAGYSQGAVIASLMWQQDFLPAGGALHHRLDDLKGVVTWGNPCREKGVANGNRYAGWPIPEGRGIMEQQYRLKDTPDWWLDFAHGANSQWGRDMYTDVADTDEGEWQEAICKIVMGHNIFTGTNGLISQALEVVQRPVAEVYAIIQAIITAGMFFGSGTGPHINYDIRPAIDYLRS